MIISLHSLPNLLTVSRIVVIPPLVAFMLVDTAWASWVALMIYTYASLTDYLDGYLARKMNITSNIGKFLDPIADKLLVAAVLLVLAGLGRLDDMWIIPAVVILVREIFIAGLREYLGPMNITLPVSKLAKWKTAIQMICLGFLIMGAHAPAWIPSLEIGLLLLVIASILAVITGYAYSVTGIGYLLKADKQH